MPVVLIDFNDTPRQAFKRGLAKGMAAPLMLFAANQADLEPPEPVSIPKVPAVRVPDSLVRMTDMQRLGVDFNAAVGRYEQEIGETAARGPEAS